MPRFWVVVCVVALASGRAWGVDETEAVAKRNLPEVIRLLETGDWNDRMHAVHELEYLQEEGLDGLSIATDDGDWQVRMTAAHAVGPIGKKGLPILRRLLRSETCPVVRLMVLHNLGEAGPEGAEAKEMGWITSATPKEVNACKDQAGPGKAPWARRIRIGRARYVAMMNGEPVQLAPASAAKPKTEASPKRKTFTSVAEVAPRRKAPDGSQDSDEAVVTRDPVLPPPPVFPEAKKTAPKETFPEPTKFERRTELDALLDLSTAPVAAVRRGPALEIIARSTAGAERLPLPVAQVPREHEVTAPGTIVADAGTAKAPHDALPDLLRALKKGDLRTRSRAADDLGHLGASAGPAVPALMDALSDKAARVRSSAGLALGNIGTADKGVVPLLIKALDDVNEDVRYASALALSRIDTPEARDAFNRRVSKEARGTIDRPKATR